jgi:hypothetical protein
VTGGLAHLLDVADRRTAAGDLVFSKKEKLSQTAAPRPATPRG